MKNQYFGDIGDFGKYGLLRFLAEKEVSVAVNWYLTPDDGRTDGKFIEYLKKKDIFRKYSHDIFDVLYEYVEVQKRRDVSVAEETGLIPGARYFSELVPVAGGPLERRLAREEWHRRALDFCAGADLVFLDPDNGMRSLGRRPSRLDNKYVFPEEAACYFKAGQNVVYYCHKGRRSEEKWMEYKNLLRDVLPEACLTGLTFHRGTQRSYIFALQGESGAKNEELTEAFLESEWGKDGTFTRESF